MKHSDEEQTGTLYFILYKQDRTEEKLLEHLKKLEIYGTFGAPNTEGIMLRHKAMIDLSEMTSYEPDAGND